jgi:hypothetical protein
MWGPALAGVSAGFVVPVVTIFFAAVAMMFPSTRLLSEAVPR